MSNDTVDPFSIATADAHALRNGFIPRSHRAPWGIPMFSLTVAFDVLVLSFYCLAFACRLPTLRHPLHRLIMLLFVCNLLGATFFYMIFWVRTDLPCHVIMVFAMGFLFGEYSTSTSICYLLFHSLVLHGETTGNAQVIAFLNPVLSIVTFGLLTLGGSGAMNRDGGCWLQDMLGWRALITYAAATLYATANVYMIFKVWRNLSETETARSMNSRNRLPSGGMLSVAAGSIQQDAEVLSKRLIFYPMSIYISVGLGSIIDILAGPIGMVIGEQLVMSGGIINGVGFFFFDPTARKIALALLELTSQDPFIQVDSTGRLGGMDVKVSSEELVRKTGEVPFAWHVARRLRRVMEWIAREKI